MSLQQPDGRRIRQLREEKGWSQEELAKRAGVSRGTIVNLEKGQSCRGDSANLVAQALDRSLAEILLQHPGGRLAVWILGSWQDTGEWPEWEKIEILMDAINCELIESGARVVMGKGNMLQRFADDYFKKLRAAARAQRFVPPAVMLYGYLRQYDLRQIFAEAMGCVPELGILIGGNVPKGRVAEEYAAAEEAGIPVLCVKATLGCARRLESTVGGIPPEVLGVINETGDKVDWGRLGNSIRDVIRTYAARKARLVARVKEYRRGLAP